jgi:hypothetical protein
MKYFLSLLILGFSLILPSAHASESAWPLLQQGGKIVFIRHAYAPGGGDPSNFSIDDCSTQRNLNQQGIDQSLSMGEDFRKYEIPISECIPRSGVDVRIQPLMPLVITKSSALSIPHLRESIAKTTNSK